MLQSPAPAELTQDRPKDAQPVLEVQRIVRNFGGLIAVNNVSFSVQRDEIFGLIGPNGAGKTTLFNIITGLTPPSSGRLIHEGQDITGFKPHRIAARRIARTFQNIRLFGTLTARENVMIAQHIHTRSGVFTGVLGLPPGPVEERRTRDKAMASLYVVGVPDS